MRAFESNKRDGRMEVATEEELSEPLRRPKIDSIENAAKEPGELGTAASEPRYLGLNGG